MQKCILFLLNLNLTIVENVLEINNLSKNYGSLQAVRNVSFSVNKGDVYGILGPNGSGKTTTLAVILGVLNANGGDFKWFGNPLQKETRQKIGSLIETPNFYPYLTLFENLQVVAKIKNASEESINYALGVANLLKRKHTNFGTLSLGMKQRMAIASVLIGDPEVLVLDEPTNSLDPEGFAEVRNIIQSQAAKGKTIIIASHILDEVEKVCSHVAILKSGDLIANGRVGELLTKEDLIFIQSDRQDELFSLLQMEEMVSKISKVEDDLSVTLKKTFSATDLNKFCFEKGFILSKIILKKQSLEAQFLELVK